MPVHDSDAVVHALYEGEAVPAIEQAFPGSTSGGKVDRAKLAAMVLNDTAALARLEAIVHPLVSDVDGRVSCRGAGQRCAGRRARCAAAVRNRHGQRGCDAVVVVSAPAEVQRQRAFERPGMTEEKFTAILAKQMPDAEKRRRADFIVDSSQGFRSCPRAGARHLAWRSLKCTKAPVIREVPASRSAGRRLWSHKCAKLCSIPRLPVSIPPRPSPGRDRLYRAGQPHPVRSDVPSPISIPSAACRRRRSRSTA